MPEALLTESECDVDACVLGTGLVESLVAAALARHGKRVLHLDRAECYGGNFRALNLLELESWGTAADGTAPSDDAHGASSDVALPAETDRCTDGLTEIELDLRPPASCFSRRSSAWDPFGCRSPEELETLQTELRKKSNQFSVDVVPRLLFGRGEMVDVLVESGVARYLEFQGLKSARVLTPEGLLSVPLTKSEIFQDLALTLPEKRMLMRFITSMGPFVGSLAFLSPAALGVDQARKVPAPGEASPSALEGVNMEEPWLKFLEKQKLSPRLRDFITYAICLWDWAQPGCTGAPPEVELSTAEGLRCLGRFVSSLGMHGNRGSTMPLLYPMYGAAEVAQGFTRMCALHKGTYALRTSVTKLLASPAKGGEGWSLAGLVTERGEKIRCRNVVASHDHIVQQAVESEAAPSPPGPACKRMTILLDCPLLIEDGLTLCVVPPGAVDPPLANVVQALQLDWSTGSCPRGLYVVHFSQAVPAPSVEVGSVSEADDNVFADLDRVLAVLLSHVGEDSKQHCLLRCIYLQSTRHSQWDLAGPGGEVLQSCARSKGLILCSDPSAVPQLLMQEEVAEARSIFLDAPLYHGEEERAPEAADFLRKPTHVAEEEQGGAMEALEAFNEGMQEAERAPVLAQADAATESAPPAEATAIPSSVADGSQSLSVDAAEPGSPADASSTSRPRSAGEPA